MGHKWKIGDWCELRGVRYLVYNLIENGTAWAIPKIGGFNEIMFCREDREVVHLPDCTGWNWQPPETEPQYRPFANAAEFMPHRGRWIYFCGQVHNQLLIYSFDNRGIWHAGKFTSWEAMFAQCKFEDGSPFGVCDGLT